MPKRILISLALAGCICFGQNLAYAGNAAIAASRELPYIHVYAQDLGKKMFAVAARRLAARGALAGGAGMLAARKLLHGPTGTFIKMGLAAGAAVEARKIAAGFLPAHLTEKEWEDAYHIALDGLIFMARAMEKGDRNRKRKCPCDEMYKDIVSLSNAQFQAKHSYLPQYLFPFGSVCYGQTGAYGQIGKQWKECPLFSTISHKSKNRKKSNKFERDHVPSFAATKLYLSRRGFKGDIKIKENTSIIVTFTTSHEQGRTYMGNNTKNKIDIDSNQMLIATLKDIAETSANILSEYGSFYSQLYLQRAILLLQRNFQICLYQGE